LAAPGGFDDLDGRCKTASQKVEIVQRESLPPRRVDGDRWPCGAYRKGSDCLQMSPTDLSPFPLDGGRAGDGGECREMTEVRERL